MEAETDIHVFRSGTLIRIGEVCDLVGVWRSTFRHRSLRYHWYPFRTSPKGLPGTQPVRRRGQK